MQSSRNTTESLTADQLDDFLTRRLKKASANIAKRKLETGEYVHHNGKVVPAYVLEEAAYKPAQNDTKVDVYKTGDLHKPFIRKVTPQWIGSRKSLTAASVERTTRPAMHVLAAAPIRKNCSRAVPRDGQLFRYDAKTGTMHPVEGQSASEGPLVGIKRRKRLQTKVQSQSYGLISPKVK
ncbi:hypothetical protein [Pantoea sp. AS142]|uniref:hypothetical protein n=1 Tax=Pantoea sp. AS142 TaxID=3081292 RepID=UPI003018A8BD